MAAVDRLRSVELAHHEEPPVAAHLLASQPHGTYLEVFHPDRDPIWWQLIVNRAQVVDGKIALPSAPGFGWEFDREFIERYPSPALAPRPTRGSEGRVDVESVLDRLEREQRPRRRKKGRRLRSPIVAHDAARGDRSKAGLEAHVRLRLDDPGSRRVGAESDVQRRIDDAEATRVHDQLQSARSASQSGRPRGGAVAGVDAMGCRRPRHRTGARRARAAPCARCSCRVCRCRAPARRRARVRGQRRGGRVPDRHQHLCAAPAQHRPEQLCRVANRAAVRRIAGVAEHERSRALQRLSERVVDRRAPTGQELLASRERLELRRSLASLAKRTSPLAVTTALHDSPGTSIHGWAGSTHEESPPARSTSSLSVISPLNGSRLESCRSGGVIIGRELTAVTGRTSPATVAARIWPACSPVRRVSTCGQVR